MGQISDCVNRLAASATFAMMQKSNELAAQGVNVVNMSVGEPATSSARMRASCATATTASPAALPACPSLR